MGTPRIDLTGKRFGRLLVERYTHSHVSKSGASKPMWECLCDCGSRVIVSGSNLRHGNTESCGCLRKDAIVTTHSTHGKTKSAEYRSWFAAKQRCGNKNHAMYPHYGGRGIKVCDRWQSFENFIADMGEKPGKEYSIDRINPDGNYEPGNCRWAKPSEQSNNQRRNVSVTHEGRTLTLSEWSAVLSVPAPTLYSRAAKGWSDHEILFGRRNTRHTGRDEHS